MKNNIELIGKTINGGHSTENGYLISENGKEQIRKCLATMFLIQESEDKKVMLPKGWLEKCQTLLNVVCATTLPEMGLHRDARELLMKIQTGMTGELEIVDTTVKDAEGNV